MLILVRTSTTESLGVTQISFYPFDSGAFLTSGYDMTVKLFSSETLKPSATFDLGSIVYSHAMSTVSRHLLVACAGQHPAVRLVDLRSGSSAHSLAGHAGSVLSVAWHPKNENVLASGASDGTCRLWDIRRSASSLGVLDMTDSAGIVGYNGIGTGARRRERGKAHNGAVNGITWSYDARYLVTVGHDERMRVWNMLTGANTLASFGPSLRNTTTTLLTPAIAPAHFSPPGTDIVYYPNPGEILAFGMHDGTLLRRLRIPTTQMRRFEGGSIHNLNTRTSALAWRPHNVELYSAHTDGSIRSWRPRTDEEIALDKEDEDSTWTDDHDAAERKRKRDNLDQIVRDVTGRKVAYM
ncbi:hypothetical protein BAUCODRAFT_39329 [Baudoinia panamericana UAMH 10762]|uniref:Uncharacterized protein n=1 Tax=Baudoinia panamericana (strain UAMH 10762) TaxID=717646 RepID=M2LBF9_BAUPA|nr:uncharacterized protein BAUCODRAFT_39329 [Baudoinia panamericana UAMH 10762]EMC91177.1 hypothetical protein BAUCODRAFT_39329 [Baudoinia panamericana UAMH 10762]